MNDIDSKSNQRELKVVDAAINEFSERGFDGATWRSIADRAGVSQGLIKFYFEDKEGLWQAALMRAHHQLVEGLPPPPLHDGNDSSPEAVATWIRSYVEHAAHRPGYIKMVMRETAAPNPRLSWAVHHIIRHAHEDFQLGVRNLQAQGFFVGLNPILIQYAFIGAIHLPLLASEEIRALYGKDIYSADLIRQHSDVMVALFVGGKTHKPGD